jgi:hypothetical protein
LINFETALPKGARFIPVYTSNGDFDLRFNIDDQTCPFLKMSMAEKFNKVNLKLSKSGVFNKKLSKVQKILNTSTSNGKRENSLIEQCYVLKLKYNDVKDNSAEEILS